MTIKSVEERMTDQRAERVHLAQQVEERAKNPLHTTRKGGYFLSSAGIPQDCEGKTLPESEWKPEDVERIKGTAQAVPETGKPAPTVKGGADTQETSGSEHRQARRARPN